MTRIVGQHNELENRRCDISDSLVSQRVRSGHHLVNNPSCQQSSVTFTGILELRLIDTHTSEMLPAAFDCLLRRIAPAESYKFFLKFFLLTR
jgi:hypothetical protein